MAFMVISMFVVASRMFRDGEFEKKNPRPSSPLPRFSPLPPPPVCSEEQRAIVKHLFPPGSTGSLTRCPHATWWDNHMYEVFLQESAAVSHEPLYSSYNANVGVRVGIALGCNKGDDAIALLSKLSGNRNISVDVFRDAFGNAARVVGDSSARLKRACPSHDLTPLEVHHPLWKTLRSDDSVLSITDPSPTAYVFCVEAGTKTAESLKKARNEMDSSWRDQFTVTHAAMGSMDGTAYFPIIAPGIESRGMCKGAQANCEPIQMYTVDTYVNKFVHSKVMEGAIAASRQPLQENLVDGSYPVMIDVLSVDVEGFDWDVLGLGGADTTLSRVKYLEFEYHGTGNWPKTKLSHATVQLWEKYSFVCYYAGVGKLWRLTNCFQAYFNKHRWSNVACVNLRLDPDLAERMEALFQSQLLVK